MKVKHFQHYYLEIGESQRRSVRCAFCRGVDIRHYCESCTSLHGLNFSRLRMWNNNIMEMAKASAMCHVFYRFWYLLSNGATADVVLHHFDHHFQGQIFSCYAFVLKTVQWQWMSLTNLPRLARTPPWSCSCLYKRNSGRCSVRCSAIYSIESMLIVFLSHFICSNQSYLHTYLLTAF